MSRSVANPDAPPQAVGQAAHSQLFRTHIGQVSRQSSFFFAGTIFTAATGYMFRVYLARVLGAEALGIYALGMTLVGFLGVFNALGLTQSAVRFVAAYSATGKWKQLGAFLSHSTKFLLGLNLLFSAVLILVGPQLAIRFYHTPALVPYIWMFALLMLLGCMSTFFGQVLTGYKDVVRRTVITTFVSSPLNIALAVMMITLGLGLKGYILAQAVTAAIVLVLLLGNVWKLTPPEARVMPVGLPRLEPEVVSFSIGAFGVGFLEFLTAQADKVLIGFYLDAKSVGIYAVAATLVAFIPILLQSVNQIFSPVIADLHARGQNELLGRMFQTLTKWIVVLTLPLAATVMLFARPLMGVFGQAFEIGWPILVIGTLGQLFNCGVGSVGYLLLMSGNQKRLIQVQAVAAAIMVVLNLVLIPRWGITGAAVAAAATAIASNLLNLRGVRRTLGLSPYNRSYLKLLPSFIAMLAACLLLRAALSGIQPQWLAILVTLPVAYAVFVGVTAMWGLDDDDRLIAQAISAQFQGRLGGIGSKAPAVGPASISMTLVNTSGERSQNAFFIVGPSRSGTTLLSRMLDSNSAIAVFPETWCYVVLDRLGCLTEFRDRWQYTLFLNAVWNNLREFGDPAASVLAALAAENPVYTGPTGPVLDLFGRAYAKARGARIWGEKTPGHVLWVSQIRELFPRARVIVCVRDPRDIVVSYDERWGGGQHQTDYLMRAAAQVKHYLNHLSRDEVFRSGDVCWVRYEALTVQPSETLQQVCEFLGLEFEPGMLDFHRKHAIQNLESSEYEFHKLLARPATAERVGRFRQVYSGPQIALVEQFLGQEMESLGYSMESASNVEFSDAELRARDRGLALYNRMQSGEIRTKYRRRARLRLEAYRYGGGWLASVTRKHLAVTSEDWRARIGSSAYPVPERASA